MKSNNLLLLLLLGAAGFFAWRLYSEKDTAAEDPDKYQSKTGGQRSTAAQPTLLDNIVGIANGIFGAAKQISQSAPSNT